MSKNRQQEFGRQSESRVAAFLKKRGYKIIEQNHRNRLGEIDIIAKDKQVLVFVEVKARRSLRFGNPKYAVTRQKQQKISRTALLYLKTTNQTRIKARFDVVALYPGGSEDNIELVKNAFELAYT